MLLTAIALVAGSAAADNGWIAGTVSDTSMSAVSGATVSVVNGTQTATTNATGYYNITVPEGNYTIKVTKTGYNDKTSSQLTVTANNTTAQSIYLSPQTGGIVGTVKDQSGAVVAYASVTPAGYILGTTTDTSGKYSLQGLSVGSVTLSFEKYGYITQNVTVTVVANTNTTKDVTLAQPTTLDVTLTGPELLGVALPLSGATVTCGAATGTTDALGMTSLNVQPGTYTVTIKASGYKTYTKSVTIVNGPNPLSVKMNSTSGGSVDNGILFGLGALCLVIILVPIIILILIIYLVIRWMRGKKPQPVQAPMTPPPPGAQASAYTPNMPGPGVPPQMPPPGAPPQQ